MPYGAGYAFESTYVYVGNNPVVYLDPSGLRKARAGAAASNPIRANSPAPRSPLGLVRKRRINSLVPGKNAIVSAGVSDGSAVFEYVADTGSAGVGEIDGIWIINRGQSFEPIRPIDVFGMAAGTLTPPCPAGGSVELQLSLEVGDLFDYPSDAAAVFCPAAQKRTEPVVVAEPEKRTKRKSPVLVPQSDVVVVPPRGSGPGGGGIIVGPAFV